MPSNDFEPRFVTEIPPKQTSSKWRWDTYLDHAKRNPAEWLAIETLDLHPARASLYQHLRLRGLKDQFAVKTRKNERGAEKAGQIFIKFSSTEARD